jgi:hypothetical protein
MDANLAKRIEVLEFEVRRWRVLTVAMLIAMTVLVVAASAPSQRATPEEDQFVHQVPAGALTARDFTLVGKDGKPYARLYTRKGRVTSGKGSTEESQPILEFYDATGEVVWTAPPNTGGFRPVEVDGR